MICFGYLQKYIYSAKYVRKPNNQPTAEEIHPFGAYGTTFPPKGGARPDGPDFLRGMVK